MLGARGGPRFEHAVANNLLMEIRASRDGRLPPGAPTQSGCSTRATGEDEALAGRRGDIVSLLPFGARPTGCHAGLDFPLRDEDLAVGPARGLSNVRSGPEARVSLRAGRLLIIETHVQGEPP